MINLFVLFARLLLKLIHTPVENIYCHVKTLFVMESILNVQDIIAYHGRMFVMTSGTAQGVSRRDNVLQGRLALDNSNVMNQSYVLQLMAYVMINWIVYMEMMNYFVN